MDSEERHSQLQSSITKMSDLLKKPGEQGTVGAFLDASLIWLGVQVSKLFWKKNRNGEESWM